MSGDETPFGHDWLWRWLSSALFLRRRPWSPPTTHPSRASCGRWVSFLAFQSRAVSRRRCRPSASCSLTRTRKWCSKSIPTWRWIPVPAGSPLSHHAPHIVLSGKQRPLQRLSLPCDQSQESSLCKEELKDGASDPAVRPRFFMLSWPPLHWTNKSLKETRTCTEGGGFIVAVFIAKSPRSAHACLFSPVRLSVYHHWIQMKEGAAGDQAHLCSTHFLGSCVQDSQQRLWADRVSSITAIFKPTGTRISELSPEKLDRSLRDYRKGF